MELGAILLHPADNVAVLVESGQAGDTIAAPDGPLTLRDTVPVGHKAALRDIPAGGDLVKYGVVIGRASCAIAAGQWVHTHNVEDITEQICNEYAKRYRAGETEEKRV